ncbi:Putative inorganic phosphate cotransporter [Eumeta japonica]|uniref:Inorganic phosphate cotransporter n=1 Tax=Eumeta variegata TaxID=151549 RepID=A0A4C1YZL5_EUMVA|nr:Putative inorganic phosphate cotransporter [Eumeta japonica]
MPIPWRQILTSPATFALMSAHVGYNWCFMMFLIETPAYLSAELQIDVASSSYLSALPFAAKWILSIVFGFACEYTYNRKYLTVTASRKLFNSIGTFGVAAGLIALSFLNSQQGLAAVALIAASAGLQSAVAIENLSQSLPLGSSIVSGWDKFSYREIGSFSFMQMNHIDVSPNFGGLIFSVNNFVANLISIAEPVFTATILGDDSNVSRWRIVFFTSAGLSVLSNFIYVIWGTAERQPWDCPHPVSESVNFDVLKEENTQSEANTHS